jgi:rhamnosyltransferase
MDTSIFAVIVSYNSDIERLTQSLKILKTQCNLVVVDNSTEEKNRRNIMSLCRKIGAHLIALHDNFGIAFAQNAGISWSRDNGAEYVLLLDDDSIPSRNLIVDLLAIRASHVLSDVVVSARTISEDGDDLSNRRYASDTGLTDYSEMNSSGTLFPMSVFDRVGKFNEELFIDCVDFEWGWRARSLGIPLLLCETVSIEHRLGDGFRHGFGWPSPIRHYYQYRNVLRMIFYSRAPIRWRVSQSLKLPAKILLIFLLSNNRTARLRFSLLGIRDFLIQRYGKYSD